MFYTIVFEQESVNLFGVEYLVCTEFLQCTERIRVSYRDAQSLDIKTYHVVLPRLG